MEVKKLLKLSLLVASVLTISLNSCNPAREYEKDEEAAIQNYLSQNGSLNFDLKPSGLYYSETQEGTGITPVAHDTAYVMYTAQFLNGSVFDTNVGSTDTLVFPVSENYMIKGFDEGITYMKAGGKALFLIPSSLAYGAMGYYNIGGYTPLLFDIYLARVVKGPGK
jgi:FKBP-type peptidyl-prolyl cis-trans isomerase FkpA